MIDIPQKMTATIKVREVIRLFGDKEFSSNNIFAHINTTKRTQIFSALRNMAKWGEIKVIRREANGMGNGSSINIYHAVNLAEAGQKPKRKPSKVYVKRVKVEPVKVRSVWEEVWPELYQVPKFKRQNVSFTNECLG